MTIISYICENGDITKETVLNDPPFDERLGIFRQYMMPLGKYIDNLHTIVLRPYTFEEPNYSLAAES